LHRQAIAWGNVAHEANSLAGGCPMQVGAAGFVSFPQPMASGKPEKFADHHTQATLFCDSQPNVKMVHIIGGFRFELSKVVAPAIRERMVSLRLKVSRDLGEAVAAGLAKVKATRGAAPQATATFKNAAPALFGGLVLPDGALTTRPCRTNMDSANMELNAETDAPRKPTPCARRQAPSHR
jgi:catalase